MGLYVSEQEVMSWVSGKVRFTESPEDEEDKMGLNLLRQLIDESEAQVEVDLSLRYAAPFQTVDCKPFKELPRTTRLYVRTMCQLQSIVRLMETDFGRATGTEGAKYAETAKKRYEAMSGQQAKLKENSYNTFVFPPLAGLRLNYMNEEADTGFKGRVIGLNNHRGDGNFAAEQINNPSEDFWSGVIDDDFGRIR